METEEKSATRTKAITKRALWRARGLKELWRRYKKNRVAVAGLMTVLFFIMIALFAPLITPRAPKALGPDAFAPPSMQYPFGTDDLGRDLLSGVLYGARTSLTVGIVAAGTSTLIGLVIGSISGYFGGKLDDILMRLTEMVQVLPRFVFALILAALFGSNIWNIVLVIALLTWPGTARLLRAAFFSLKEHEFVEAAKALGESDIRIMFSEILPNAVPIAIINGTLEVAHAILLEAGISYLGLGDANVISWGYMLMNAQSFLNRGWWMAFFPGLSIFLVALGFHLFGDGLNEAINPRLKER